MAVVEMYAVGAVAETAAAKTVVVAQPIEMVFKSYTVVDTYHTELRQTAEAVVAVAMHPASVRVTVPTALVVKPAAPTAVAL